MHQQRLPVVMYCFAHSNVEQGVSIGSGAAKPALGPAVGAAVVVAAAAGIAAVWLSTVYMIAGAAAVSVEGELLRMRPALALVAAVVTCCGCCLRLFLRLLLRRKGHHRRDSMVG